VLQRMMIKNEVGTLAVDRWAVTFGTAKRRLGGVTARYSPPRPLSAVPNVTAHHQQPVYQSPYCCIMVSCLAVLTRSLKG